MKERNVREKDDNNKYTGKSRKKLTITVNDVADYLIKNSDKDHKVSRLEITAEMCRLYYGYVPDKEEDTVAGKDVLYGERTITDQVKRILKDYTGEPLILGIRIECTGDIEKYKNNDKIFYASQLLSIPQVNMVRDAILAYPYMNRKETRDIIDALNDITPEFNEFKYDENFLMSHKHGVSCHENIVEITKALSMRKYDEKGRTEKLTSDEKNMTKKVYESKHSSGINKIQFEYYAYNENKELEPRPPHYSKAVDKKAHPYLREENPVRLMWANGYYYLVTYYFDDKGETRYINYRVDRMKNVRCTDKPIDRDKEGRLPDEFVKFRENSHREKNAVMMSSDGPDRRKMVVMKCSRSVINNVLDTFGLDVKIEPYDDNKNVKVTLTETGWSGVKMWALEYYYGCEILKPKALREEMKKAAAEMLEKYNKKYDT